jgi:histone-lysine N-methyltransferase SETMAR
MAQIIRGGGTIRRAFVAGLGKSVTFMNLEQRYFILFHWDDDLPTKEIFLLLGEKYGEDALSLSQVYYWTREFRLGRRDVSDAPRSGRPPDEGIPWAIHSVLQADPLVSARAIARTLKLSVSTVLRHLTDNFQMKYRHLKWVPHRLTSEQKAKRAELAGSMLETLRRHRRTHFRFLYTGDESWMFYSYPHTHQWVASLDDLEEIERGSHFKQKRMLTVFFNGDGDFMMNIMPKGSKMDSAYFTREILLPLASHCYGTGRGFRQQKVTVHFDNAPIHGTAGVQQTLAMSELVRMEHPPYSPDLAPCDFFLFGYVKNRLKGAVFSDQDELYNGVRQIISEVTTEIRTNVFSAWMTRLENCVNSGGEYQE